MGNHRWRSRAALALLGAMIVVMPSGMALGEPSRIQRQPEFQDENGGIKDKDARGGKRDPSARQRALAAGKGITARWNKLGTPATLTKSGRPLAIGLSRDPERAARDYLAANRELLGVSAEAVNALETVAINRIGDGAAVLLRQRFGNLAAGFDGLVAVGVVNGSIVHLTSSLARDVTAPAPPTMSEKDAVAVAAADAGMRLNDVDTRHVRLVAVPTAEGARSAYQVTLVDNGTDSTEPAGYTSYVDARSRAVLIRENLVDHDSDNPHWAVFPANPAANYSSTDTREIWCAQAGPGCDQVVGDDPPTGLAWDVTHATGTPTYSSVGNAARTTENRASDNAFSVGVRSNVLTPDRNYVYPWTNQWHTEKCDPATLDSSQEADLEAAMANLFVMHNRMHDWSYRLGFTETAFNMQTDNGGRGGLGVDPEQGNAQAGARIASVRDNANQITPPDGIPAITNMYLWQPIAGGFYAPCVDGDFDMSVIGHEYTHAISGRMIAGPDRGWSGPQAGAMNESTSDLFAMEYRNEYAFPAAGNTPYVIGAYVTGDPVAGIRNYDMSRSPLNYSDIEYDLVGQQVHADGEIWSATQFAIREAMVGRYGAGTPALQKSCADGTTALNGCPGNRRWAQLSFDALLLMASGAVSYVDHRDALLAADAIRFGGANQDILWNAFAAHGLGSGASSAGSGDPNPVPSFASPYTANATATLKPGGDATGAAVRLYVGDYEGRAMPVADTDPATPLGATFQIVPGAYSFVAAGAGFGHKRFTFSLKPGQVRDLPVQMFRNLASAASGASVSGDGINLNKLIDDTEATNWASRGAGVAGRQVTVDLAGATAVEVRRVQVSAMLRPPITGDADAGTQNRFSALRQFEVLACDAATADCTQDGSFRVVYVSPADAFPSTMPRPRAPELIIRSFEVPRTTATHLRIRVLTSQCTGTPAYAGEQDNDPRSVTDCATGSPAAGDVRAAEFQVFSH